MNSFYSWITLNTLTEARPTLFGFEYFGFGLGRGGGGIGLPGTSCAPTTRDFHRRETRRAEPAGFRSPHLLHPTLQSKASSDSLLSSSASAQVVTWSLIGLDSIIASSSSPPPPPSSLWRSADGLVPWSFSSSRLTSLSICFSQVGLQENILKLYNLFSGFFGGRG